MNKRLIKKIKTKELNISKLAVLSPGILSGYTCPTCSRNKVKEPFCPRCKQRLIYDTYGVNTF